MNIKLMRKKLSAFVTGLYKDESVYYVYEHFDPDTNLDSLALISLMFIVLFSLFIV